MRKRYTPTQKAAIVLELIREVDTLPKIAARHGIHPNQLYKWKAQVLESLPQLFADGAPERQALIAEHDRKLTELYAEIGRLTTQLDWLKKKSGLEPGPR
jgi:putative transposase